MASPGRGNLVLGIGAGSLGPRDFASRATAASREILRVTRRFLCHNRHGKRLLPATAHMAARKKNAAKHKAAEILIPDKLYFRIGEVAALCHLPAYVLRFWESEFPQLKPVKSSTGQRMYRRRDVEGVLRIKQLLYEQGFTISGARQQLRAETKSDKTQSAIPFPIQSASEIQHIRQGLREILNLLSTRRTG